MGPASDQCGCNVIRQTGTSCQYAFGLNLDCCGFAMNYFDRLTKYCRYVLVALESHNAITPKGRFREIL